MLSAGDFYAIAAGFFGSFSVILLRISGFKGPPLPLTFFKSFIAILGFAVALLIAIMLLAKVQAKSATVAVHNTAASTAA